MFHYIIKDLQNNTFLSDIDFNIYSTDINDAHKFTSKESAIEHLHNEGGYFVTIMEIYM